MQRRTFLRQSSAALATAGIPSFFYHRPPAQYTTALIGSGWWGMNILQEAIAGGRSKVVALCDVDQRYLEPAAAKVLQLTGSKPRIYADYREMLQKEKPQVSIVATPDHWHALTAIEAIRIGSHVYLEKPVGHTINEGKAILKAARAQDRVVQVGTHRRISPHNMSGMAFLKSGKLGKVGMVRAFVHYGGGAGQKQPVEAPPKGLDWNAWCGPAPLLPYHPGIHPRGFRQYLDFANGQLGDWGIHWLDQILWWTEEKGPRKIYSTANRFIKQDATDAPDTQVVNYEFESFIATWEHRLYGANEAEKSNIGCYFYGTEGTFHMGWTDGWTFYPSDKNKSIIHRDAELNTDDKHNIKELWANFITSIDEKQLPVCDILKGHRSTTMSLLGMLSWKLGRSLEWNPETETFVNDPAATALLRRDYRGPWIYPGES
jgi:predicted dehydrogenase